MKAVSQEWFITLEVLNFTEKHLSNRSTWWENSTNWVGGTKLSSRKEAFEVGRKKKIATQILRFDMATMKTGHGPTWVRCLAPRAAHHSPWKSACWGQTAGGCGCGLDLPPGEITSQQKSKSFNASDWGWTQQTPGLKNQLRAS